MTLTVTERCNLRCAYCYMPVARGRAMDPAVADSAVDLLRERAAPEGTVTLAFFGGEPFLAKDTVRRAIDRARPIGDGRRRLRLTTTTNGLALDASARALCRESGMELALSIDGDASARERPFAGGRPSAPALADALPEILALDPGAKLIARMTVTPDNVANLARGVRSLARAGFGRIFWLPAYELAWSDEAVRTYGRELRRIGTWLVGARSAGARVPELPAWRGIEQRLTRGVTNGACGAGVRDVAVATDGRLLACYRLLPLPEGHAHELGDVTRGFTNEAALELFASLDPKTARPEDGDCERCSARRGCTHFCPALGVAMRDDPRAVPASVCRLMRAAVDAVRASLADARPRAPSRAAWPAAALVLAASSVACGGTIDPGGGICASGSGGGVCPAQVDAGDDADDGSPFSFADAGGGGICPVQLDATTDAQDEPDPWDAGGGGGGLCPPPPPGLC